MITSRWLVGTAALFCLFSVGCSLEPASDIRERNQRLEEEITRMKQIKAEIPLLQKEIDRIREEIVELETDKQQFLKDNPGIEEDLRKYGPR